MKIRFHGNLHLRPALDRDLGTSPRDDAERVSLAYERWGERCVDHLHGDFSFVISDESRNRHFGARDRLGIQPFFYTFEAGRFRYERRPSLLPNQGVDEEAYAFALANDWSTLDRTPEKGVRRLLPGTFVVVNGSKLRIETYFTFQPGPPIHYRGEDDYAAHFRELLEAAVLDALPPTGAAGLLLSGGVDSSAIAATIHRLRANALESFSARFACASCDDAEGLELALSIGNWPRHLFYPERDPSILDAKPDETEVFHYPTQAVFRPLLATAATRGITVMISGCGGDDVFTPLPSRWIDVVPDAWVARFRRVVPRALPDLIHPKAAKRFHVMERIAKRYRASHPRDLKFWRAALHRRLFVWGGYPIAFEQEQLFAARFGIERRYPLFDLRLIEYAFRIPRKQMVSGNRGKRVLRNAMQGLIPSRQLTRLDPTDFTPLNRRAIERVGRQSLAAELIHRELVAPSGVEKLWRERALARSHEPLFRLQALERLATSEERDEKKRESARGGEEALPLAGA